MESFTVILTNFSRSHVIIIYTFVYMLMYQKDHGTSLSMTYISSSWTTIWIFMVTPQSFCPLWCCVCIINSYSTLLNWPIVNLLILYIYILFSMIFVLMHDYSVLYGISLLQFWILQFHLYMTLLYSYSLDISTFAQYCIITAYWRQGFFSDLDILFIVTGCPSWGDSNGQRYVFQNLQADAPKLNLGYNCSVTLAL